jgi:enoyl-CoA hydratase/carnithine racemase
LAEFVSIEKGLGPEGRIVALASLTEDHKEGVKAFLDRRKPRFRGR